MPPPEQEMHAYPGMSFSILMKTLNKRKKPFLDNKMRLSVGSWKLLGGLSVKDSCTGIGRGTNASPSIKERRTKWHKQSPP